MDFSKIESGKLDLEDQPFDLVNCVEEAVDLLATRAAEKGLELAIEIDPAQPRWIRGDVTRLRQILVNLVSNALKFTASGEVVVTVKPFSDGTEESGIHFAVRDTGCGIPADRLDRLFRSFSQVDASTTRKYGGTGLGLAISKKLTEIMGGRIWVESEKLTMARYSSSSFPTVSRRSNSSFPRRTLTGRRREFCSWMTTRPIGVFTKRSSATGGLSVSASRPRMKQSRILWNCG